MQETQEGASYNCCMDTDLFYKNRKEQLGEGSWKLGNKDIGMHFLELFFDKMNWLNYMHV